MESILSDRYKDHYTDLRELIGTRSRLEDEDNRTAAFLRGYRGYRETC